MFDRGDKISQYPDTTPGIIVNYGGYDEDIDESTYQVKWPDGKITTEYENTLNYYCNPDDTTEDMPDEWENYSEAFNEMYDLIEEGKEFPDAKETVTIKFNLSASCQSQLVIDYDECERKNAMTWRS